MALTRVAVSDDDGTGTTGTLWNAAQRNADFDIIDGRWTPITITSTSTQNNLSITASGVEADFIIFNNASDLTVTGFAAPSSPLKPGKPLRYVCIGAGNVFFAHQNGSSTAANRLINIATSANTPHSAGGGGMLTYDGGAARWRLVLHEQGDWIDYSTTSTIAGWSAFTVKNLRYKLEGRKLSVAWSITGTSNSIATSLTIPFTASSELDFWQSNSNNVTDNGTVSNTPGAGFVTAATSTLTLARDASSTAWTASGSKVSRGQMMIGVT